MVNDLLWPKHPVDGTTVIVEVIGVVPEFVAVNNERFPVPLAGNPIAVLLFVHE
jgi:hypothetical protein